MEAWAAKGRQLGGKGNAGDTAIKRGALRSLQPARTCGYSAAAVLFNREPASRLLSNMWSAGVPPIA